MDYSNKDAKLEFDQECSALLFITHLSPDRSPQFVFCNKTINNSNSNDFKYFIKDIVTSNQHTSVKLPAASDYIIVGCQQQTIKVECYVFGDAIATFTDFV